MAEHEFSAEAKRRFAELRPDRYRRELRRLGWKITEAQFLFGLVLFLGAITPLFALAMSSVSGGFAIIWTLIMAYSVVKAFRRIGNPVTHMEVRQLILEAEYRRKFVDPIKDAVDRGKKNREKEDD